MICFIRKLCPIQKKRWRMTNLLQENRNIESQRTSIHICNSHEPKHKPKIAKEYAFSQRSPE